MRGDDVICGSLFSYIDLEKRVSAAHPLRVLRQIANAALKSLSGAFAPLYSPIGRVSIPPERQLVDRLDHDLLFRWFVGLGIEDAVWDATTFTKNRDRLLEGEMAGESLAVVLSHNKVKGLLSSDHFSVDRTLLEAWASVKSFRPKDGSVEPPGCSRNGARFFTANGGKTTRTPRPPTATPDCSAKDPKGPGKEAPLCFMGHAMMENRNGLVVGAVETRLGPCRATGGARRRSSLLSTCRDQSRWKPTRARQGRFRHGVARAGDHPGWRAESKRALFGN